MAVKPTPVKKNSFKSPADIIICPGAQQSGTLAKLNRLADFVSKSSQPLQITLVLQDSSWDTSLTAEKTLADTIARQKMTILRSGEKSVSKALLEAATQSTAPYIFPYHIANNADIEVVCRFLGNLNKTEVAEQSVLFGSGAVKTPAKPIGIGKRYLLYMSNIWHRLLTGIDGQNTFLALALYPKELLLDYLSQLGNTGKSAWYSLMAMCVADKQTVAEVPLDMSSQPITAGSGFVMAAKAKLRAIAFIINWFVKAPLQVFRKKSTAEGNMLSNGSHPAYRLFFFAAALITLITMVSASNDYNITWDEPNHNNYANDVLDYYSTFGNDTSVFDFHAEGHTDYYTNVFYGMSIDVFGAFCNRILGREETAAKKDVLGITISADMDGGDTMFNSKGKRYGVDESGNISLKQLGSIPVAGKTLHEIKETIRQRLDNKNIKACISACYISFKPHTDEFAIRHLLNALTGFLCLLFGGLCARQVGGWRAALLVFLAMLCSPSFFGHSFNNPKDIPFAMGFVMGICYLIRLIQEMPNPRAQTKIMLSLAIGFAISIRVPGLMLILFVFAFMGLHWLMQVMAKKEKLNSALRYITISLVICIIGYVLGVLIWPYALRAPLTAPLKAFKEFQNFSYLTYYELFEGVRQYIKPWYYEPKMIMITAPLLVLGGLIIFVLTGLLKVRRDNILPVLILLFVTFVPAAYSIYKKSYVYNGWRHFLFIYPTLVVLSVLGWEWLMQILKQKALTLVIMLVILAGAAIPGYWAIKNHPYQYMYFNELTGGLKGAQGLYETDYWNQTPREAFAWLVKEVPSLKDGDKRVSSNNIQESLKTFNPEGVKVMYKWTREYEWANDDWKYAIWTTRTLSKNQIQNGYWPPKGTIKTIDVDGVPIAAIVKSENNYGYLGHKYLSERKADSSIFYYQKALVFNPREEEFARGLADACRLKGNNDSAITFYNRAADLRDGNFEAFLGLGECYFQKATANPEKTDAAMLSKARENFEKSVFYKENNASAYYYLGEIVLSANEPELARDYFNKTISHSPNVAQAYNGLGKAQMAIGEADSALNNFYIASQLDSRYAEPLYYLATELQKRGDTKQAQQFRQRYEQLTGMPAPF